VDLATVGVVVPTPLCLVAVTTGADDLVAPLRGLKGVSRRARRGTRGVCGVGVGACGAGAGRTAREC
jgi:hypothetical protein